MDLSDGEASDKSQNCGDGRDGRGETGAAGRGETGAAGRGLLAYQSLAAGEAIHSSTKSA